MKSKLLLSFVVLLASAASLSAQIAPSVNGDKDLRDTDIKRRSAEMDRIERESKKGGQKPTAATEEDKLAAKYEEIKTDFEQIQKSQDKVIETYRKGQKVDYAQIGVSASEINQSALRLRANLFPADNQKKAEKESAAQTAGETKRKNMRDLIVELDVAIGRFITSPMFANLRVVEAETAKKAGADLRQIIELSAQLEAEARQKEAGEKQ